MNITAIKTFVIDCFRTNWVFVKVLTDEGLSGIGEGTLEYKENALVGAVADLEHALIGQDPFDTERIWHTVYRDAYWRGGPVLMSALSAIDMALWDLKGKALGLPVWKLIGGKCREGVPCYANCWFAGAKEPAAFAERALMAVERGFKGLKWDPFGKNYRQLPPDDFKRAIACVEAVKGATAGKAEILIECHGRFDLPTALRICDALADFDPYWVEEPIIPDTMRALADLRSRVRVPIACGERLYTVQQVLDAVELRACDYLQPDASHAGGITAMKKIAAICEARHIPFCAHNPSGPVANAVTLALGVSTPGYCIHETLFDDVPWRGEVIDEDVRFADGVMYPSDRPGLGIELDEAAAARHPKVDHWLRHYAGTLTDIRPVDSVRYYREN
ncbi:MAG: mandelate racemase/muconate lactonizing enzyme family protein [Kiritimatiellae bacterium]|nr:mandelate racemase/muconate lactonizing enzyme family protein [Kiritimatiellia bacterium]